MKHKKSVLKILSANFECFRVSDGIAPNIGVVAPGMISVLCMKCGETVSYGQEFYMSADFFAPLEDNPKLQAIKLWHLLEIVRRNLYRGFFRF